MEEKIFYDSDNNIKLCGILNKSNNDKIVIMCHGIRGNKEERGSFTYLAEKFEFIENGEHTFQNSKEAIEKAVAVTVEFIKEVL